MSRKIYKYIIEPGNEFQFEMPEGAEILSVQVQRDNVCLWALVDTEKKHETRYFEIFGTGFEIQDSIYPRKYIGTFQVQQGDLVFHIFESIQVTYKEER